jgi:hypothetical protein
MGSQGVAKPSFYRIRVCLPGSMIHLASATEPVLERDGSGRIAGCELTPLVGAGFGDAVGFIDWRAALAITWRPPAKGGAGTTAAPVIEPPDAPVELVEPPSVLASLIETARQRQIGG